MKDKVLTGFKNIPEVQKIGVYAIHNKANNKYYIGSSCNIYSRMKYHNINGTNRQIIIDRCKYKPDKWELLVLKTFEDGTIKADDLIKAENYYIDKYDSINKGYNVQRAFNTSKNKDALLYCRREKVAEKTEKACLLFPKGTKERIKAAGFSSVNGYINELIKKDLEEREKAEKY